jgi:hypothetical protein
MHTFYKHIGRQKQISILLVRQNSRIITDAPNNIFPLPDQFGHEINKAEFADVG